MRMIKMNDIIRRINPIDQSVLFSTLPYVVWPIFKVMIVVNVAAASSRLDGITFTFPITICTANASPKALAIPRMTAVNSVGNAAGIRTLRMVCHLVAPNAYEPSRRFFGNELIASVAILVMVGNIIMDRTTVPASKLNPSPPI